MQQRRLSQPREEIFHLVLTCRYGEVVQRCASHPNEVRTTRYRSEWCPKACHRHRQHIKPDGQYSLFGRKDSPRTLLHTICADGHVPADVVSALLEVWPEAASIPAKRDGRTPLHNASCVALDPRVLQVLLDTDQNLLQVSDKYHRTPLVHLCHTFSATLRQALGNSCIDGIRSRLAYETNVCIKPRKSRYPLELFWRNAAVLVRQSARDTIENEKYLSRGEQTVRGMEITTEQNRFKKNSFCMVHACLSIGKACPIHLLALAIKVHPEQSAQGDENDDGNLPLHVLCKRGELSLTRNILDFNQKASTMKNRNGSLPLHRLATRVAEDAAAGLLRKKHFDALNLLISAYPEALLSQEVESGLTPFMLAASASNEGDRELKRIDTEVEHEEKKSAAHVSAIYQLLRSNPTI